MYSTFASLVQELGFAAGVEALPGKYSGPIDILDSASPVQDLDRKMKIVSGV